MKQKALLDPFVFEKWLSHVVQQSNFHQREPAGKRHIDHDKNRSGLEHIITSRPSSIVKLIDPCLDGEHSNNEINCNVNI